MALLIIGTAGWRFGQETPRHEEDPNTSGYLVATWKALDRRQTRAPA